VRKEDFFEVIGELDDDIVKGAKAPMKKKINWKVWGTMAACLAVVAVLGVGLFQGGLFGIVTPDNGKTAQPDTVTITNAADAPPMVYVNGTLYKQNTKQISYGEMKEEFIYLGKIKSNVTNNQSSTDGIPKENFQANIPIVGAEVYQYGDDVVIQTDNKYWLYEAANNENTPGTQEEPSGEEKMLLDPSYAANADAMESAAEEAAKAYYADTVFEIVSLELERQTENEIIFSVSVSKGGVVQEPNHTITLQRENETWKVINEGY